MNMISATPPTLDDILHHPVSELLDMPIEFLAELSDEIKCLKAKAENAKAFLDGVLTAKYKRDIDTGYAAKDDPFGTVRIDDGHMVVVVDLPKKISWDANGLEKIETLLTDSWNEDPAEYIVTKKSVPEIKFKSWPKAIQDVFIPARTVSGGKITFKIEEQK